MTNANIGLRTVVALLLIDDVPRTAAAAQVDAHHVVELENAGLIAWMPGGYVRTQAGIDHLKVNAQAQTDRTPT